MIMPNTDEAMDTLPDYGKFVENIKRFVMQLQWD